MSKNRLAFTAVTTSAFFLSLFLNTQAFAHRDSDIDNLSECELNQRALENSDLDVVCNDLYHLYSPQQSFRSDREKDLIIGAFNVFKLGSGDSRFKDLNLTAQVMSEYDVIAVSELHPSLSEEFDSNSNLIHKASDLNFSTYYHKPGYLDLLDALRELNSSWTLILSPSAQSDNEELLGFYFKADTLQLDNSDYCKAYNRVIREKDMLRFSGSHNGPTFGRKPVTPYLKDSFACLLDINQDENSIARIPFSARFKVGRRGFDFNLLSHHARFKEPVAVGGTCGYECLEKISFFFASEFHKEGEFIRTLDLTALRFLKNHIDFLLADEDMESALYENYSPVIKFKHSKPRVYTNMMLVKEELESSLEGVINSLWENSYKNEISSSSKNALIKTLLEASKNPNTLDTELVKEFSHFVEDVFNQEPFSTVIERYDMWTSPSKISRFFETALILKEMETMSDTESDSDIILGGDFNLEPQSDPHYWQHLENQYVYATVGISSPTTISKTRGPVRSYDHFMYSDHDGLQECKPLEASVSDFVNDHSYWDGFEYYFVKSGSGLERVSKKIYDQISKIRYINSKGEPEFTTEINVSRGYRDCWTGQSLKNTPLADDWRNDFECKTLRHYLENDEKYRIYTDLISDHLPIKMKCNDLRDLD